MIEWVNFGMEQLVRTTRERFTRPEESKQVRRRKLIQLEVVSATQKHKC